MPVKAIIKEKIEKVFAEFVFEHEWPNIEHILQKLMTGEKTRLVFILDAPTSRAKIVTAMIDKVGDLLKLGSQVEVHLLVPCGTRLDLLSGVANRIWDELPVLGILHHAVDSPGWEP